MILNNLISLDKSYKFIRYQVGNAEIYFSTAEGGLNFNKNTIEGLNNLDNLKNWFHLKEVGYLNQIHSDTVCIYDGSINEGDALITDRKNVAIGVFTADCVPIIIYDEGRGVIAAVHSGWKGTLASITIKTIEAMQKSYDTQLKDVSIFIGPHNMKCCYEVGEELIDKFKKSKKQGKFNIFNSINLSMQDCIVNELMGIGLDTNQIHLANMCTFCNEDLDLFSYRKVPNKEGRMFSFIVLK